MLQTNSTDVGGGEALLQTNSTDVGGDEALLESKAGGDEALLESNEAEALLESRMFIFPIGQCMCGWTEGA